MSLPSQHHQCSGCLSRRHCLKLITTAAAGLAFSGPTLSAFAKARKADPNFVDPASLRPHPKVRLDYAVLEMPRPYWLGWPGTTYNLDAHQKEYRGKLTQSCQKLGIELHEEEKHGDPRQGLRIPLDRPGEQEEERDHEVQQHEDHGHHQPRAAQAGEIPEHVDREVRDPHEHELEPGHVGPGDEEAIAIGRDIGNSNGKALRNILKMRSGLLTVNGDLEKGRRWVQCKHAKKNCHSLTKGL